jgi:hypothetical protein
MSYEKEIEVYKGKYFLSNTNSKTPIIIAFDLDETLGSFSDLETLWSAINKFNNGIIKIDFNNLLDLYPEFIRYGILSILEFLCQKKKKGICYKIYIYTNNQCSPEWCKMISNYFDYKLKTDSPLFDQIICAFKINNKVVEINRTTHNKTYNDFIKCTLLPKKTKICFIDNTYFYEMKGDRVYYIQPRSYIHNLTIDIIIERFLASSIYQEYIHGSQNFLLADFLYKQFLKKDFISVIPPQDNLISNITIAQKMMYHIKDFFYLSQKKIKTRKIKYSLGKFTRKRKIV